MPIASVGSVRVQYKVDGAGPPLALVPGTGADSEVTWAHLVEHFADRHMRNMMEVWRRTAELGAETFGRLATITAFSPTFLRSLGAEAVDGLVSNTHPTSGTLRQIDLDLRLDTRDLLPRIAAETLVIGSTQDRMVPVANPRSMPRYRAATTPRSTAGTWYSPNSPQSSRGSSGSSCTAPENISSQRAG